MAEPTPFPLGRKVEHDPQSRAYRVDIASVTTLVSAKHARHIGPLDQGNLGSCVGNAATGVLATDPFFSTIPVETQQHLAEAFAVDLYSLATQVDDAPGAYPPDDTGTSGLAVSKVLKSKGLISGYTHAFSTDDALRALVDRPLLVGVNWYRSFFYPDPSGHITVAPGSYVDGGHEFVVDEINAEEQYVGATNSWGPDWGDAGRFYMDFTLFDRLLSEQGDAISLVPITQPAPFPSPTPVPVPPSPAPTPGPAPEPVDVDAADAALWAVAQPWAGLRHVMLNKRVADALTTWAKSKGLE